jgi:DNA-binding SARP family transcriptional activator
VLGGGIFATMSGVIPTDQIRFRALGAISVDRVLVSSPQTRRLLAHLLVHRNRPVPQAELIDSLWDGDPPPAAVSAFQSKVSRLRKILRAGDLISDGAGYTLVVPSEAFDVDVFESLGMQPGDPTAVLAATTTALELWSGAAFDIAAADPFVQATAQRCELLRVSVLEHRMSAYESLCMWDRAIADALQLISIDPFNERPWLARARCLGASGRTAEALRVLERFRNQLAEETGLLPTPDVQRVENELLGVAPTPPTNDRDAAARSAPTKTPSFDASVVSPNSVTERQMLLVPPRASPWNGEIARSGRMVGRESIRTAARAKVLGLARDGFSMSVIGPSGSGKSLMVSEIRRMSRDSLCSPLVMSWSKPSVALDPITRLIHEAADRGLDRSADRVSDGGRGSDRELADVVRGIIDEAQRGQGVLLLHDDFDAAPSSVWSIMGSVLHVLAQAPMSVRLGVVIGVNPKTLTSDQRAMLDDWRQLDSHSHWVLTPLDEQAVHSLISSRSGVRPTSALSAGITADLVPQPGDILRALERMRDASALFLTPRGELYAASSVAQIAGGATSDALRGWFATAAPTLLRVLLTAVLPGLSQHERESFARVESEVWLSSVRELERIIPGLASGNLSAEESLGLEQMVPSSVASGVVAELLGARAGSPHPHQARLVVDLAERHELLHHPTAVEAAKLIRDGAQIDQRWHDVGRFGGLVADVTDDADDHLYSGIGHFRNHDADAARVRFQRAVAIGESKRDVRLIGLAELYLQRTELALSRSDARFDGVRLSAVADAAELGAPDVAAECRALLAEASMHTGDQSSAVTALQRAEQHLGELPLASQAAVRFAKGLVDLAALRLDSAGLQFELAQRAATQAGDAWKTAWATARLALVRYLQGRLGDAAQTAEVARSLTRGTGNWSERAIAELVVAQVHAARGSVELAEVHAHDALDLSTRSGYSWTTAPTLTLMLWLAVVTGDDERIEAVLRDLEADSGPRQAQRWRALARPDDLTMATELRLRPFQPEFRYLSAAALRVTVLRRDDPNATDPCTEAALQNGVEWSLGWPFRLSHFASPAPPPIHSGA